MFFSTSISLYLYLLSKVEDEGFFAGFNPPKISFTNILATRLGVPFRLSSVKSIPRVVKIFSTSFLIDAIFSSSVLSKASALRSEEHTSELQSRPHLVCRLLPEKKKK